MSGRTTVVIAHRLSTIRNADAIAVVCLLQLVLLFIIVLIANCFSKRCRKDVLLKWELTRN
jgi:hypothetical protein